MARNLKRGSAFAQVYGQQFEGLNTSRITSGQQHEQLPEPPADTTMHMEPWMRGESNNSHEKCSRCLL